MKEKIDLLQGTLDLLGMKALTLEPLHGLGVSRRIEQITKGAFQVKPGSISPALLRLEEAGWLKSSWGESEKTAGLSTTASRKQGNVNSKPKPRTGSASRWRLPLPLKRHREKKPCH